MNDSLIVSAATLPIGLIRVDTTDPEARQRKWDLRYLEMAKLVASWSKDPSTKTGAVIVAPNGGIVSTGFNGLPRKIRDSAKYLDNREVKYQTIIHCERNALIYAQRDLTGCTLFTYPFMSCSVCASMMIQAGITRHVAPNATEEQLIRWADAFRMSHELFVEAGVQITLIDPIELTDRKQAGR